MKKYLSRIGVTMIFKRHLQTFYNYGIYEWSGQKKVPPSDIGVFVLLPLLLALGIVYLDDTFVKTFSELIVTSLSIFIGLLFSLLTLIFDLAKKEKEIVRRLKAKKDVPYDKEKAAFTLVKEMFVNISYAIVLSVLCIIFIFLAQFRPSHLINWLRTKESFIMVRDVCLFISNAIVVFLLMQFLLTLLMILRRFFIVFNYQIEKD